MLSDDDEMAVWDDVVEAEGLLAECEAIGEQVADIQSSLDAEDGSRSESPPGPSLVHRRGRRRRVLCEDSDDMSDDGPTVPAPPMAAAVPDPAPELDPSLRCERVRCRDPKSRGIMFGFTLFGPDDYLDNFIHRLKHDPATFPSRLSFMICQEEVTSTVRRHLQGSIEWMRRAAYTSLRTSVFGLPRRTTPQRQQEIEDRQGLEILTRRGVYLWSVKVFSILFLSLFTCLTLHSGGGKYPRLKRKLR